MLGEPVQESGGELVVAEDPVPLAEGKVGGDDGGGALVASRQHVEEQLAAGLLEGDEAELVEEQERGPAETSPGGARAILASRAPRC